MKLNSAYICVKNMKRAIQFYENFLEQKVNIKDTVFSIFVFKGFRLCLFNFSAVNERVKYGDNCLLSFEVDDIKESMQRIKGLKAPIVYPLAKIGTSWVFEFRDSEGNDVEVYSKEI